MAHYKSHYASMVSMVDPNNHAMIAPAQHKHGLEARERINRPSGSVRGLGGPSINKIPRSEWDDRLEQMDKDKSSLWHLMDLIKSPVKNQNGISYCWVHGITRAVEVRIGSQRNKPVLLSATSVGCKIKGFRNQGGWGRDAIEYEAEHGVVPMDLWPENKLDRQYDTPEAWAAAENFIVDEWDELPENDFDMEMSYAFECFPFGLGLDWWGHLVCGMVPIGNGDGTYSLGIDNSWDITWGTKGRGILSESKARGDACSPRRIRSTAI